MFSGLVPFIQACIENLNEDNVPNEINLVLDGGAFGGAYTLGGLLYLRELVNKKIVVVKQASGTSIGAILGTCFVANQLDSISHELLQRLLGYVKNTGTLELAMELVDEIFDWESFIKHGGNDNRMIISYTDLSKPHTNYISHFDDRKHLLDCLKMSIHLPWITTESCTVNGRFIDGISPKLIRDTEAPTLFISTMTISYFGRSVTTKGESNFVPRIITGIEDVHHFFSKTAKSNLCSYVNEWSFFSLMAFRSRDILSLMVYLAYQLSNMVSNYVPDTISENYIFCKIVDILSQLWRDFITQIIV